MTDKEKNILLKDLCCRLPYGVICHANEINIDGKLIFVNKLYDIAALYYDNAIGKFKSCPINDIKPYLRPLLSMTEEEKEKYLSFHYRIEHLGQHDISISNYKDWLNAHHLDYRGLIPMGLALEAKEGMYNIE